MATRHDASGACAWAQQERARASPGGGSPVTDRRVRPLVGRAVAVVLAVGVSLTIGCAIDPARRSTVAAPLREAVDAPTRFLEPEAVRGAMFTDTVAPSGCRNPMVDPRDGTRLRLVRSEGRIGDFEVPDGRYGVRRGEVLRLDCAAGRVLGIATRQRDNP